MWNKAASFLLLVMAFHAHAIFAYGQESSPPEREAWFPIKIYGSNVRLSGEVLAGTSGTLVAPRRPATEASLPNPLADWWHGSYLLGKDGFTPLNLRGHFQDRGLSFDGNYQGAFFGVVASQKGSRGFWDQQLNFGATWNLGKFFDEANLEGLTLFGSARYRDGWPQSNPNEFVQANGMFNPSNWQSGTQFRLLNFGFEWDSLSLLPVEHMLTLKGGWLQPQKEFVDQPLSKLFLNNAINSAKGIGGNIPFSSSFSTWGGTITFRPLENFYTKHAIFMSFPQANASGNHGLALAGFAQDPSRNGLFYMGESGFTPLIGPARLPGKYAFGGYYYGTPPRETVSWNGTSSAGQYGFYFQADQMLYREASPNVEAMPPAKNRKITTPTSASRLSDQGLKTFNLLTFAPGYARDNVFPFYFQSGLVYTGLLPGRDLDLSMIAFGYGAYQGGVNTPDASYSAVLEGGYRFQINGWSYIQPFFQYLIRPNGTPDVRNAAILGFMTGVVF
jgi:porin